MPLYEYRCEKCGAVFEALVRTSSEKPKSCPKCGHPRIEKQFSTFAAGHSDSGSDWGGCAGGSCGTSSCPTGTCPFGGN